MKQNIKIVNYKLVAQYLSQNFIGAIATGRAEAGPRALGNRSILSDARLIKNKERINGLIKNRSAFQPLAPICLDTEFDNYFEKINCHVSYDYMLYAVKCKPLTSEKLPAIVHSDNTARVQIITEKKHPIIYEILSEYKKTTNIGVLINTSFNGKGEPIVNSAEHAFDTYKRLGLDFLILNNFLISSILW